MEQKNGKISVIIPIYNVEPYLRQCLNSIVNQTYRNLEIILVDDGSPDHCGAICDEYSQKDDRIVVIHKQNGGVGAARNDGIERATGEWVAFVDPDDWCDVDFYERLFDAMRDQNIDVFCSGGYFRAYENKKIEYRTFSGSTLFEGREQTDFLMAKVLAQNCVDIANSDVNPIGTSCDKLYKRSFLFQNQLKFDTSLHLLEDLLFNFIVFDKAQRVVVCDHIGYYYRQQVSSSATHKFNPQTPDCCFAFINRLYDYMRHREPNELIQNAINARTIREFSFLIRYHYFHKDNPNPYRVTASEIRELKREPAFDIAIHSKLSKLLSKKQFVLKCLLRLPWVWPLKLAYSVTKG